MHKIKEKYDVVIIGSGLGGLLCGYMLSKEGKQVCILEKNAQIGGNLQTFKRDRVKFDSGVHYIGGLDEGKVLNRYFKYFGLWDRVEMERLDEDGYDRISFQGDDVSYPHGQGYDNFIAQLAAVFPDQKEGLEKYCAEIQYLVSEFELYNLGRDFEEVDEMQFFSISAKEVINRCVSNTRLQGVLAGNNMLYAGHGDSAPFYVHALITDSYISGAYKMKNSDQISNFLRKDIKKMGSDIFINAEVVSIENDTENVQRVLLQNGQAVYGNRYISNMHPTTTFNMLDTSKLRKVNVTRMKTLQNTISTFILYIKLKPNTEQYVNYNRYHYFQDDVWSVTDYTEDDWVKCMAIFNARENNETAYAHTITALAYMRYDEVKKWENSFNTTLSEDTRGEDYLRFKEAKAREMIVALEKIMPGIANNIESYYTATPLTQRDYTGSTSGAVYGILHDYNQPLQTLVKSNTKLKNLFLTGQNIILHGVLGVTIGAVVTCQNILGKDYLLQKIKAESIRD